MNQPEIIHTLLDKIGVEQKSELISLIKSDDERNFVSELSMIPTILILVVALFLALFARGAIKDAFMFTILWEIKRLPEYFLLFTAQIFFVLLVLYSLTNYINRINRYGWVNTSFGLIYIEGQRLTIYKPESIEKFEINQLILNYKYNTGTKRWVNSDSTHADFSEKTKKYDIEISIKGQIEKEIFTISNITNAYGFVERFYQNANSETRQVNLPQDSKFFSTVYKWFIVCGIALIIGVLLTVFFVFPFENKMVIKEIARNVIDTSQPGGITRDKEMLIHYIQYCKNGENYTKAMENLREFYKAKINPVKTKLLNDKGYRYEYFNLLTEYEEYVNDGFYRDEIELLKDENSGYEHWRKRMTE
jgi:hypothetical protein